MENKRIFIRRSELFTVKKLIRNVYDEIRRIR